MTLNVIEETKTNLAPFEVQAQLFKVLTHPARIAILHLLRDGEHCVCHLEAYLGFRQAYISQQLAVLREAGLIQDRRDGWNIYYRVVNPRIFDVLDSVEQFCGQLPYPSTTLAVDCPCPHCAIKTSKD